MSCDCEVLECEEFRKEAERSMRHSQLLMDSIRKVPHESAKILLSVADEFFAVNFSGLSSRARGQEPAESFKFKFADGSSITWSRK